MDEVQSVRSYRFRTLQQNNYLIITIILFIDLLLTLQTLRQSHKTLYGAFFVIAL